MLNGVLNGMAGLDGAVVASWVVAERVLKKRACDTLGHRIGQTACLVNWPLVLAVYAGGP